MDETKIHQGCIIGEDFKAGHNVIIDEGCVIGKDVKIDSNSCLARRTIVGDGTFIGPGVITLNSKTMEREFDESMRGPKIGRKCRIGAGAIIFPDIRIGDGAWVGPGSVVTHDVKPGSIVVGNPAEPLPGSEKKKTEDWKELHG